MEKDFFNRFIGEPLESVQDSLEQKGFSVQVIDFSKPMMKVINKGDLLVVKIKFDGTKNIILYVSEFKIDI